MRSLDDAMLHSLSSFIARAVVSTCTFATQQQISELHVCFIMFWFNYISRCSCIPTKFSSKPIGTIVNLVLQKKTAVLLSEWVESIDGIL